MTEDGEQKTEGGKQKIGTGRSSITPKNKEERKSRLSM